MFRNLLKLFEKRNTNNWIPLGQSISGGRSSSQNYASGLPVVRRCLQLYRDLLLSAPICIQEDDKKIYKSPYISLIKKPNNFLSQAEFFSLLVENFWIHGNFICYLESNQNGRVTSILPFVPGSIWGYPASDRAGDRKNANNSDPIFLNSPGAINYIYAFSTGKKDANGKEIKETKRFSAEDIMHLRSQWVNNGDYINGSSITTAYPDAFEMATETIRTGAQIAINGLMPQQMLSGVEMDTPEKVQELEQALDDFNQEKRMFLSLPEGVEIKQMLGQRPESLFQILSSVSSLNASRIFNLPIDLVSREDGGQSQGGQNLKESFRFWTKTSGKAFLKMVADKLSEVLPPGMEYKFLTRGTQASDLRELSMSLKQMVEDGILTNEKAQEWIADI